MNSLLIDQAHDWLVSLGITTFYATLIVNYTILLLVFVLAYIADIVAKKVLIRAIIIFTSKTTTKWDDELIEKRVLHKLAHLVPAIIINTLTPVVIPNDTIVIQIIQVITQVYMVVIVLSAFNAFFKALNAIYNTFSIARSRPIKSYIQVVRIILYIFAGVIIISILMPGKNIGWLAGFGAFSAVTMLVFKDPILGFVGGIQLTSNNMVQIGDWISMPKYGADGDVVEISLTSVKVQNFDKTIVTIPTYTMVTDSFQNWRGMEESGGRRIKRSINIDMNSVKFCTPEMLQRYSEIDVVKEYIESKNTEIEAYNSKHNIDNTVLVNGRRQTNLGVFRAYLEAYLRQHPNITKNMTFLIRQLQPASTGIPIEVYVFSKIQDWVLYEGLQSDIFDHILAVIPHFDLQVFQNPSGSDFTKLTN